VYWKLARNSETTMNKERNPLDIQSYVEQNNKNLEQSNKELVLSQ
jgi:hypothetical protein